MDLQWQLFYGVDGEKVNAGSLTEIPFELEGVKGENIEFSDGIFEGKNGAQEPPEQGVFFAAFEVEEEKTFAMGFGGCYFYQVFLNGTLLLDRSESGNKPYFPPDPDDFIVPAPCGKGTNLLTVVLRSAPGEPMRLAFRIFEEYPWQKTVPSIENFERLVSAPVYPAEGTQERKWAYDLIQNGVLMLRNTVFNPFSANRSMEREELTGVTGKYPVLYFYEKALDRIIKEIAETTPEEDEVFFWLLYNMGYVIKCAAGTFGLDLNHRRAAELAPYLDFLLTTHNHADHYDMELFKLMGAQKKKVVSNFHPLPGFHRPPAELEFEGISIVTQENDHNPTLQKFVTSYYITLPNGCTIFASGDSRNVEQLDPPGKVDVFIPHPRVGLSVPAAVDKFKPAAVLYSHFLEMRHTPPTPWYAVPYDLLESERQEVAAKGAQALAPIWGEKLLWNTSVKRFI